MSQEELNQSKTDETGYPEEGYQTMVDAGVFLGRKKSRTNPRMKPYILATRNGLEIINLAKTKEVMDKALAVLASKVKAGGIVLFVGVQPAAEGIQAVALSHNFPVVTNRWLGGTLTNYKIISKRIEYFKKLKEDWAKGVFTKYTKKEQLGIEREMKRLTELMGTLETLVVLPQALVVVDPNMHLAAVREAKILRIPIIGFVNTDTNPDLVDFPVAGNNKARVAVNWFLDEISKAITEAKASRPVVVPDGSEAPVPAK